MLLFLGSGISLNSGLPGVEDITKQLLEGSYFRDLDHRGTYYEVDDIDGRNVESVDDIQKFLQILKFKDKHYLETIAPYYSGSEYCYTGSIDRKETSYENLFYLSDQIRQSGVGLTDNAMTGAFVDLIEKEAKHLLSGETRVQRLISLYHLSSIASNFVEWMIAKSLHPENEIEGLDLIVELAKNAGTDANRLDIITLNHDTLVEQMLAKNRIPFVDGFGPLDGNIRWYDDALYDSSDARVRIFKPHGSVDWFNVRRSTYPAIVVGSNPQLCRTASGQEVKIDTKKPVFLSGGNKELAYNKGIFSETLFRFHQVLREHQFMVMSGYGWGDTAVNFRLMHWLEYGPSNRLMLLHQAPEDVRDRCMTLAAMYRSLVEKKRLILTEKWLSHTTYDEVRSVALEKVDN